MLQQRSCSFSRIAYYHHLHLLISTEENHAICTREQSAKILFNTGITQRKTLVNKKANFNERQ